MRVAYCFSAEGDDYVKMMRFSEHCLKKVIPDADIIEIGREVLSGIYDKNDAIWYTHLAIPVCDRFNGYDKVVFLDADCEVVRPEFKSFFDLSGDYEVWGRKCFRFNTPEFDHWEINSDRCQINGGCVGYNLCKIDKEDWMRRLRIVANYNKRMKSRDEGWLFYMTNPKCVDNIYNNEWGRIGDDVLMIHHRSLRRKRYMERVREFFINDKEIGND